MLICGSGSGIRDPLKTNSRGKLLVFRVVVANLFLQNTDSGRVVDHSKVTEENRLRASFMYSRFQGFLVV
jgi:hypothetical protein